MTVKPAKPVFIVGSPRSGTTWLYHLLLSSGSFAIYRSESQVYNLFGPAFGQFRSSADRRRFLDFWLDTEFFHRSGLAADTIGKTVLDSVRSPGDFLRLLMDAICEQQGAERWAECTPDHGLSIRQIKADFPDALFVHIVRDGRDVALSLAKKGYIRALPWGAFRDELAAAAYWGWITRKIDRNATFIGPDLLRVHYEDLISDLHATLRRIGEFIDKPIEPEAISGRAIGSVVQPNSSFTGDGEGEQIGVSRWQSRCTPRLLQAIEDTIGPELGFFSYARATASAPLRGLPRRLRKTAHAARFEAGRFLKRRGLSGSASINDWKDPQGAVESADPTLRPGENLAAIQMLVQGKDV